ncbi:PqqD family peptide modification chaperone [Streptomyces sp. TP-A0874]|uniref:PqqD family peptide modification chaperone n=1 Tax=Streptomyces sp. TP-A0874 TaxID=549819 RepID=UPI000853795A|nr:PqqD family peptide modification chaperone [Streptomyces sp. TP-A0874]
MLTLTPGARVLTDRSTGWGTLITADGRVVTLNPSAAIALSVVADGGTAADAEDALVRACPEVPIERIRVDLDALLASLQKKEW